MGDRREEDGNTDDRVPFKSLITQFKHLFSDDTDLETNQIVRQA
jgi:hypothetical protein